MAKGIAYTEEFGYGDVRVTVTCPYCEKRQNFWMADERTEKLCHVCSKVTFVFICSIPKRGILRVEVHCKFVNTAEAEIDPDRIIILRDEDVADR